MENTKKYISIENVKDISATTTQICQNRTERESS